MNYFGYYRISNYYQRNKEIIKAHKMAIYQDLLCRGLTKSNVDKYIYRDISDGTVMNHPNFNKMMKHAKNGDVIIVNKFDSLGCNGVNIRKFLNKYHNITIVSEKSWLCA